MEKANYSPNTTPLRERVERHEEITAQEYTAAVKGFSENLAQLYDIVSNAMTPAVRDLLARVVKESDDLTAITCILPEGPLREETSRAYDKVTRRNPEEDKSSLFDYNDRMQLACNISMFLRRT